MVLKNLDYLVDCGKLYEVRTVVVPELFNNEETVTNVAHKIKNSTARYKLIKYRHLGVRENNLNLTTPTDHDMNHLERLAHEAGCFNTIIV